MRKVKTAQDLVVSPRSTASVMATRIPPRTVRNIRRGHLIKGMRDIAHVGWQSWEEKVSKMQNAIEMQRFISANRYHEAIGSAKRLLKQSQEQSEELRALNEEQEASNEELQATTEELQATNEEMEATSEELRLAGAYSRSLIEASLDTLVTIGPDGKITDVNSETEAITGCSREELIGTDFSDYFTDPEKAKAGYQKAFEEGVVRDYPLDLRRTTDGRVTPVLYNASVFRDEAGEVRGVFAAARDVTEQRKTEKKLQELFDKLKGSAKLIQAGKMGAVGTMTTGIAHELNNPMMGILNFVQYCLKHTPEDDRRYAVLQDAERETKRCNAIVQNLLTFSRMEQEGEEEYQEESCAVISERVLKLLSYRIEKENVLVTTHTAEGTPKAWMKTNNIQQVFFNLINNALDSVKKSEKKEVLVDIHPEGEFVQVTIADTGCGISPENLEKIFDPFFTTKPVEEGTGLGLSISHSIITGQGGELRCESEPGTGTKFKILLPIEKREEETR